MSKLTTTIILYLSLLSGAVAQNRITTDTIGMLSDNEHLNQLPDSIQTSTKLTKPIITRDTLEVQVSSAQDTVALSGIKDVQALAATLDAGRTEATLDVSASGGATYTLPFKLPPGIDGVVPQVGLIYNSQGENGTAGYGWNVYGLSSITRVGAAEYTDGRVGGINFNSSDRFALDGQRLLLKSGTYGADGAEYQTEQYSNLKIISRGVSTYGPEYGPAHFEVYYPDGTKAYYGTTPGSRSRLQYGLTFTENPQGIRIGYLYSTYGANLYIREISYGRQNTSAGINQVVFNYAVSSRTEQNYIAGVSFNADRRVSKISVVANGVDYRHYVPTYGTVGTLNYQRMTQIQEFDGTETRSLSPIVFSYNATNNTITSSTIPISNLTGIASNNSKLVTADFTGDGEMDFILYPNSKDKFYFFYDLEAGDPYLNWGTAINTGFFREIFPMTWLTVTEKVLPGQGMLLARNNGTNKYKFDVYAYTAAAPVLFQYTKLWDTPPLTAEYYSYCDNQYHDGVPQNFEFVSGDFNGDGLTDVMAISRNQSIISVEYPNPSNPAECIKEYEMSRSFSYFINMDRRKTTGYVTNTGEIYEGYNTGDQLYTADFDGDGKTDILIMKSGSMVLYSLNSANNNLAWKWSITDSRIQLTQKILLGDYNGDGKMDVMFSTGYNNLFTTFMSTGKGFIKHEKNEPFSNVQNTASGNTWQQHVLVPTDINGDGKTDIIHSRTITHGDSENGQAIIAIYHNTGTNTSNQATFSSALATTLHTNVRHNPIPIFLNPDRQNPNLEYGYISDKTISLFRLHKDMLIESQLAQVSQDGVVHNVHYSRLMQNTYANDMLIYESSLEQVFPYIDIQFAPQLYVVDRIARTALGNTVQQVFGYRKAVSNAEGLGFLGFGETIRSNLHINSLDSNRMFTIGIQNPQLRGAMIRTFTSKSSYLSQTIKDMPLTDPPPAGGISDGATLFDYVNRQDQVYCSDTLTNKVFVNVPVAASTKDLLHGTYQNSGLQYDSLYNITHTWEDINGTASKSSGMTYTNNTDIANYHVGRLLHQQDTIRNAVDTMTSETQYTYTGYLPTVIKQKGHQTAFMIDSLTYDVYGNVTQRKTTVPGGAQRTETMEYDASGRFLTTYTDTDTLATHYSYDDATGNLDEKTDPYGRSTSYEYDNWGRQTVYKDYLENSTTTTYNRVGATTYITEIADNGAYILRIINSLGERIQRQEKNVLGTFVSLNWRYDAYGRQVQESAPGSTTQWNTIGYDSYGRIHKEISYTDKTHTYSYNGLVSYMNDGIKTVITTKNASGNTLSVQDPGGTVNYTYFADGNLKIADYGGSVQTVEQDGWGRKTKLTDPSAGVYTYEYDGWGQVTKEINPKGETQYTYDSAGKLISKSIIGDSTNMQQTYTYDPVMKFLLASNLINADGNNTTYNYTYDSFSRLKTSTEENPNATFYKSYAYNTYGLLFTETVRATHKATNVTSERWVLSYYQNGQLQEMRIPPIPGGGQTVFKVDSLNNRGQLKASMQGPIRTSQQYDDYGYPQQKSFIRTPTTTLVTLGTTFNAQRGFPTARSNSAFSWNETFGYDNLDRLTSFNDNNGNHSQQYDGRGRITENSRQGIYGYTGNSYRQNELELNPAADAYYQSRELQQIAYNAFKSPVEIHEPGHDRISFQYNGALKRSHMYYGGEQADPMARRYHKHYAEDGSAEITYDTQTDEVTFVLYLGGDAYSAPAIWKEIIGGSSPASGTLYYLHRDYLGSIVMVTNEAGEAVEKRHFDAWGNIVKLTDGSNNNLTNFIILDRGFTGHEHLTSVGLIHMNGRLYDARLGRFLAPDNYVQDLFGTQTFNRYGYALNNPLVYVDPDGEFIHIIVGAIVGGVINLGVKLLSGQVHDFWQGVAAFGIGAAGGAVTAATGGAVLAATGMSAGSVLGGVVVSASGFATGSVVQNVGNHIVFGDPLMSGRDFAIGLATSAVGGAVIGGVSNKIWGKGTNLWTGQKIVDPRISVGNPNFEGLRNDLGNITPGKLDKMPLPLNKDYTDKGIIFRSFTSSNFRHNLAKLTGDIPRNSQAHHVFPQKYVDQFSSRGIDIHNPKYGAWWETTSHLKHAKSYNDAWGMFFKQFTNPTQTQILQKGRELMLRYNISVGF